MYSLNEKVWISVKISLKFIPKGPALLQIMAWCQPGNKPLSESMMVSLPTHICPTRPQWVYVISVVYFIIVNPYSTYILIWGVIKIFQQQKHSFILYHRPLYADKHSFIYIIDPSMLTNTALYHRPLYADKHSFIYIIDPSMLTDTALFYIVDPSMLTNTALFIS